MERKRYLEAIERKFRIEPVCGILGPRQVGKTTLAHTFIKEQYKDDAVFYDLEKQSDLELFQNPHTTLSAIDKKCIVIDEVQRRPDLFMALRVIVDQPENKDRKFLILGSASRDLIRQSSETLAGRIGYIELPPFGLLDVTDSTQLWLRGGFPRSYLAPSDAASMDWRKDYITTFLERDIPNLGFQIPPAQLLRFWYMLAHYHGQIFNASEIGRALGISYHTAQRYLDILAGTFMIRVLHPWFENLSKRQVKASKIYFRDSGILHGLLDIADMIQLQRNPKLGAFWEGFALEQLIQVLQLRSEECFFWSTQSDAELDFFTIFKGKRLGFEFKYADSPKVTKSMYTALEDLKLDHLFIMYPGEHLYLKEDKISLAGLETIASGEFMKYLSQIVGR